MPYDITDAKEDIANLAASVNYIAEELIKQDLLKKPKIEKK